MQSAIEYAAIPTINLTPLFLVTNPLTNSSQSDTLNDLSNIFYIGILSGNLGVHIGVYQPWYSVLFGNTCSLIHSNKDQIQFTYLIKDSIIMDVIIAQ